MGKVADISEHASEGGTNQSGAYDEARCTWPGLDG